MKRFPERRKTTLEDALTNQYLIPLFAPIPTRQSRVPDLNHLIFARRCKQELTFSLQTFSEPSQHDKRLL
jgi:hypothetical protein